MSKYRRRFVFMFLFLVFSAARSQDLLAQKAEPKGNIDEAAAKAFGNLIAIETGELQDGEQIPLPRYQDGKQASRRECHYFVSPREISTAFSNLVGSGAYYIKCFVDSDGVVHISLWQRGADGSDFNVVEDKAYEDLKRYYESIGTQYEGAGDFRNKLIGELRKRMAANYMVIALRSQTSR